MNYSVLKSAVKEAFKQNATLACLVLIVAMFLTFQWKAASLMEQKFSALSADYTRQLEKLTERQHALHSQTVMKLSDATVVMDKLERAITRVDGS